MRNNNPNDGEELVRFCNLRIRLQEICAFCKDTAQIDDSRPLRLPGAVSSATSARTLNLPLYLLFPLAAAAIYALSSLFVKRALGDGVSLNQAFHITNIAVGLVTLPVILWQREPVAWEKLHLPLVMALSFFAANWFTTLAIRSGDVSLVTPIMGTKVVFVALGTLFWLRESLPQLLIFAAFLATLAIFMMGVPDMAKGRHFLRTTLFALCSAATFGTGDLLLQAWADHFGRLAFVAVASAGVGLFSLIAIAASQLSAKPFRWPKAPGARWIWIGTTLVGIQAIFMGVSLATFHDATGINVVYSLRGLWAIVFVGLLGSWFENRERHTAGKMFVWRVLGTVVLTVAIVLAVIARSKIAP